jgi:SAM-dependent methyltransferase
MSDPREETLARWNSVADGWIATRERFQHTVLPVSHWMIDAIRPQPGHRVLELAAGLADTGLLAAEVVAPGGEVIITDGAEAMVQAARAHAGEVGATNVEVREMQAEWIDLPAASVDAVLCRFGYMLLEDPEAALRETRRVLKPGGRVALAVWAQAQDNPWITIAREAVQASALVPAPPPTGPGPMALSEPGVVQELLEATGFDEIEIEPLDVIFEAESLDAWWGWSSQTSALFAQAVSAASPAKHYRLREAIDAGYAPYVRDDGSVSIPGRALVAAATA